MLSNDTNPLPGVPDVESPFFDELFDPGDAIYPIARDLHETGYAVIDFPEEDFDAIAERLKGELHSHYNWQAWNEGAVNEMRSIDLWRTNDDVRRIATNPRMAAILSRLYGRNAFPFQTLSFPVGTQQHFHSDSAHFSSRPERFMCGVWVALEDIGPENGPLVYYPGSHNWPIYTREHIGVPHSSATGEHQKVFEPMWERLVEKHGVKPAYFEARKGQALIWAANLLHGGAAHNDRSQSRWSQVTHYYFDDCVYYTPLASNEPAGEILVRRPENIIASKTVAPSYLGAPLDDETINHMLAKRREYPLGFDPERYLKLHPDVAKHGLDPWDHYNHYGRAEGRQLS